MKSFPLFAPIKLGGLLLWGSLPGLVLGCADPGASPPHLARFFQADDAEFVEVGSLGRWARRSDLPAVLVARVDLPANADLLLPWSVTETPGYHQPVEVALTITEIGDGQPRQLLKQRRRLGRQREWFEEHLALANKHPRSLQLELTFAEIRAADEAAHLTEEQVLVSPLIVSSNKPDPSPRPDVILIAIDTLRADRLSPYGATRPTPTIDRLAASGTLFEEAFSTASWTLPSFASVFTSTYPWTHQARGETKSIAARFLTMPEVFAANGYRTLGFHHGGFVRPQYGFARGFDEYSETPGLASFESRVLDRLGIPTRQPLLLFLHTYDVHAPYTTAPAEYHDIYTNPDFEDRLLLREADANLKELAADLAPDDLEFLSDLYDGEVRFVDDSLATILQALDTARSGRPRIVVLFSDHGESFGEQGRIAHGNGPDFELVHVPLIFAGEGIPAGRRVPDVTETMGLLPTLVDLLGLDLPPGTALEGRSFALSLGPTPPGSDPRSIAMAQDSGHSALRTLDWSLIVHKDRSTLHDRRADPKETEDVSQQYPEITQRLEALFDSYKTSARAGPASNIILDPATLDDLRALGYVD